MNLLGLGAKYVGALIAAGTGVAIVLYLRQWGRRRVVVAFTPLWKRVLSEADVGTSRRRVLELLSLLLQIAVVVLLALALGRPLLGRAPGVRAIVIDTSASMLAKRPPRGDRLAIAKQRALEMVDRLSGEDRVALITTGGEARLLYAPTRDHYAVRQRIARLSACACDGRLREGVEIARGIVSEPSAIDVLTDGNESLDALSYVPNISVVAAAAANIGITLLGVRPAPSTPGLYDGVLEVRSFAPTATHAQLRLSIDGQLVDVRDVRLKPGERQTTILPAVSAGRGEGLLKAELFNIDIEGAIDALAEDNVAFALLAPEAERPVRLLAPANQARFVREVLRANPRYRVIDIDPAQPDASARTGAVTVVDGVPTPTAPGRYLVLAPRGAGTTKLDDAQFTDWRTDHPILRHVSLQGISIRATQVTTPPAGAQVLARFGDVPLLYILETMDRTEVGTTFDAEDSNLPLRVAFPVFVYNAIDWLSGADDTGEERSLGRRWRIERLASGPVKKLKVDGPSRDAEISLRGDLITIEQANAPGLYRIEADDESFRVAASLTSAHESDLAIHQSGGQSQAPIGRAADLWSWLIYAALGVLILEWTLYHRRVTS